MAVFLPCSCGHRLPANATTLAPGARCPACGLEVGDRSVIVEPEAIPIRDVEVLETKPLRGFAFRAVEVGSVPPSREPPPPRDPQRPIDWQTPLPMPADGIPYAMESIDPEVRRNPDEIEKLRKARRTMRETRLGGPRLWNSWEREKNGLDCLGYPIRAWGVISVLSFFLTLGHMTIGFILSLAAESTPIVGFVISTPILFAFAILVGIWLRSTLLSGEAGECNLSLLNRFDFPAFLLTLASGMLAFLGGPILAFVMTAWFWVSAGQLGIFDRAILLMLGWIAYAWWIAGGLAAHDEERILSVHPAAIARMLAHRGRFILGVCLAGGLILALTSWWIIECHYLFPKNPALAFFLALIFWWNALFWLTYLARWLGLVHFWRKPMVAGS
ncbi:MAG: hypothetical protein K2X38_09870 [Gemmataceae bacterium]|nr:hypothetical protein [Gemmataceae bacterium]